VGMSQEQGHAVAVWAGGEDPREPCCARLHRHVTAQCEGDLLPRVCLYARPVSECGTHQFSIVCPLASSTSRDISANIWLPLHGVCLRSGTICWRLFAAFAH
jgi:hypothetical protein